MFCVFKLEFGLIKILRALNVPQYAVKEFFKNSLTLKVREFKLVALQCQTFELIWFCSSAYKALS